MIPNRDILQLVKVASADIHCRQSLPLLARRAGWSPFHLHRAFRQTVGETPRQFIERLRLERAAATLAASKVSVVAVALAFGFGSHEVFSRAFRRHFDCTPTQYRQKALTGASAQERATHLELMRSIGPCVRLFHLPAQPTPARKTAMPAPTITFKQLQAQPILFIQRRVPGTQLQPLFAECFGKLYMHGHQAGLAIAGHPMARYVVIGAGLWTVDSIMPLLVPATSEGEMQAGYLADGEVVLAVHTGPYERLPESYVAIEHWMEANNLQSAGPHWESYVTDPGEVPDPEQWRTEIFWPVVAKSK